MLNLDHPLQRAILTAAWRHRFRPAISGPGCRPVSHLGLVLRGMVRARQLRRLHRPIALRFPKNTELVEHLLGVLLAGGTYVCVDRSASEDWMEALRGLDAGLLLHGAEEGPSEPIAGRRLITLPARPCWGLPLPRRQALKEPWCAALVRTSGSFGEPCGVLQEAGSILHHAWWTIQSQGIDSESRLSWLSSPGVAAAHSHLFASLLSGACLCPFEPSREGLPAMSRWLRSEQITHLHLTPSLLRAWLESLPEGTELPDLRSVKLGGEPARASDARLLWSRLGTQVRLFNGLGMSEATGNVALCEISPLEAMDDGVLPVGRPVDGRVVVVEVEPGRPAAEGESGEIVVRDQWVSPGYQPAGARAGIRSPEGSASRELRTGDVGRWDASGRLVHLGRMDRRIRVRGISVDLAEVEACVAGLPTVRDVAAVPEPDGRGYRLAVVPREEAEETCRRELGGLFRAMRGVRPASVAFPAEIPRRPNGKRDDASLLRNWPAPEAVATWTPREAYIREAWIKVLRHADFGPDDRFSEVGGDSLAAMNLAVELERIAQRQVEIADLVRFPTVACQARALERDTLGVAGGRPAHAGFHMEWVHVPARHPERVALVHPGGYCSDSDVWLVQTVLADLAGNTTLMFARSNIRDPRIEAPHAWSEIVEPLWKQMAQGPRPLFIGVCIGSLVVAELAERLSAAGCGEVELVLLDPWTPGLGRSAAGLSEGEHPPRIQRYYELFKGRPYPELTTLQHVVLSEEDSLFAERRRFWSARLPSPDRLHRVRGNHLSFLREHSAETGRKLGDLLGIRGESNGPAPLAEQAR